MALNVSLYTASRCSTAPWSTTDRLRRSTDGEQGTCSMTIPRRHAQTGRCTLTAQATSSNGRDGPGRRRRRHGKASTPGMFEVEQIEGKEYVVTSLILQYKLQRGRYVRDHCKLQVLPTGRYFYNEFLTAMMEMTPDEQDTGKQD